MRQLVGKDKVFPLPHGAKTMYLTNMARIKKPKARSRAGVAREQMRKTRARLGARSIVLVGMMGAGKTSVGKRLAKALDLPFQDADAEIELAAGKSIADIFAEDGEEVFRSGEERVIKRLLEDGPKVLATGGGAFERASTRENIAAHGVSVWLDGELEVLWERVSRKTHRPLLKQENPKGVLKALLEKRNPTYAKADCRVESRDVPHEVIVSDIIRAVNRFLTNSSETTMTATAQTAENTLSTVRVDLGKRSYDIEIGHDLLAGLGERIKALAPKARAFIVTDEHLAATHLGAVEKALAAGKVTLLGTHILPAGETTKCFAKLQETVEAILAAGTERNDLVIALGGGVIGDLTGFAAAISRRDTGFVQIPTSLLAQVDSSVGGKTGINTKQGKNLVGAFHQPKLVLADMDVLKTLPLREFRAGYAEVAKYGLIDDAGFFSWLEENVDQVFAHGPELGRAVEISCRSKARIVAADETEKGQRALLNLGHTFGHALEGAVGYDPKRLIHGEAIAIGMVMAFTFSANKGLTDKTSVERVKAHFEKVGLPTHISQVPGGVGTVDQLMALIAQDKKVSQGSLTFILTRGVGKAFIAKDVAPEEVRTYLQQEMNGQGLS